MLGVIGIGPVVIIVVVIVVGMLRQAGHVSCDCAERVALAIVGYYIL